MLDGIAEQCRFRELRVTHYILQLGPVATSPLKYRDSCQTIIHTEKCYGPNAPYKNENIHGAEMKIFCIWVQKCENIDVYAPEIDVTIGHIKVSMFDLNYRLPILAS